MMLDAPPLRRQSLTRAACWGSRVQGQGPRTLLISSLSSQPDKHKVNVHGSQLRSSRCGLVDFVYFVVKLGVFCVLYVMRWDQSLAWKSYQFVIHHSIKIFKNAVNFLHSFKWDLHIFFNDSIGSQEFWSETSVLLLIKMSNPGTMFMVSHFTCLFRSMYNSTSATWIMATVLERPSRDSRVGSTSPQRLAALSEKTELKTVEILCVAYRDKVWRLNMRIWARCLIQARHNVMDKECFVVFWLLFPRFLDVFVLFSASGWLLPQSLQPSHSKNWEHSLTDGAHLFPVHQVVTIPADPNLLVRFSVGIGLAPALVTADPSQLPVHLLWWSSSSSLSSLSSLSSSSS